MKDKVVLGCCCFFMVVMILGILFPATTPSSQTPWDEEAKDGWTFVGRTPEGRPIKKKYFSEHGVWIFATYSRNESISAVPVEILQRTKAGDSYK